jgi:hypothetical protein
MKKDVLAQEMCFAKSHADAFWFDYALPATPPARTERLSETNVIDVSNTSCTVNAL